MGRRSAYFVLVGTYALTTGAGLVSARARRRMEVPRPGDVAMLGIATFKLSRLVSKAKISQPLREPFVERSEPADGAEVNAEPVREDNLRGAVGELLTCPFCISVWIATALTLLYASTPRMARLAASALSTMAVADVAQYAYAGIRQLEE